MKNFERTNKALNKFGLRVITFARGNLLRQRKNASGSLRDSIDYDLKITKKGNIPSSFRLQFLMEDYATFIEDGVNGTRKKYGSPYSYSRKQPPSNVILQWIRTKPVRLRDSKGRYRKQKNREIQSLAFLIARKIKERGIKPTPFFFPAFEKAFDKIDSEVVDTFALELEDFYAFTLQDQLDGNN